MRRTVFLLLLVTLSVSAADSFYGTWKMRLSGPSSTKQTVTIEAVADGAKVTTDIDYGNGTGMTLTYTTKLDGAEVPVYSSGKVVMTIRAKRTGPNAYEGSTAGPGGSMTFKTTISADGKVMTSESTSGSTPMQSVFDRVK